MTDVTVVVPTHDRWDRLERTLRCVLRQEGIELEVIVVDDGSADTNALSRLATAVGDGRMRPVVLQGRRGMAAARNEGAARARTEWLAFLDDDDLWSPTKLCGQRRAAEAADMVYSGVIEVDDRGRVLGIRRPPPADGLPDALRRGNVIPAAASNVMLRKDVFLSVGGFDESLTHLSDWDLWLRLANDVAVAADQAVSVAYVKHPGNRGFRHVDEVLNDLEALGRRHGDLRTADHTIHSWMAATARQAGMKGVAAGLYVRSAVRHAAPSDLWRAARALRGVAPGRESFPGPDWLLEAIDTPS